MIFKIGGVGDVWHAEERGEVLSLDLYVGDGQYDPEALLGCSV